MPRKFTFTTQVYDKKTDFPQTGDVDVIYIDASKNIAYRYDDSYYTISSAEVDIWGAMGSLSKGGGGGGGASWGSINGTLSNQTDLNTALSEKQNTLVSGTSIKTINSTSLLGSGNVSVQPTLTLTTTGTSGAATLSGATLNIPQYGGGSANPSVIVLNATDGTAVTGIVTETISRSLLIPANTFTGNGMLEVVARILKTGVAGSQFFRIYKNTTNSLTGATLIGLVMSGSTQAFAQAIRTYRINANTITGITTSAAVAVDYTTNGNPEVSTTFTTSVDNYIIFAIQLQNASDSSVIRMARATKYI
jgi:hypothetical protein